MRAAILMTTLALLTLPVVAMEGAPLPLGGMVDFDGETVAPVPVRLAAGGMLDPNGLAHPDSALQEAPPALGGMIDPDGPATPPARLAAGGTGYGKGPEAVAA